jgi:hypothetical protein
MLALTDFNANERRALSVDHVEKKWLPRCSMSALLCHSSNILYFRGAEPTETWLRTSFIVVHPETVRLFISGPQMGTGSQASFFQGFFTQG